MLDAVMPGIIAHAQMRILPRERVDSLVRAQNKPREWSASFLQFDALSRDAGSVRESDGIIQAEYHFRNTGSESICLGRMETSCTCVTASCSPVLVKPDSTATLVVRYDPSGHPGRHPRYVSVHLREPVDTCVARVSLHSLIF